MLKGFEKAAIALCGGISAWGVTAAADGISLVEWFGLVGVIGTALGVALFPNSKSDELE